MRRDAPSWFLRPLIQPLISLAQPFVNLIIQREPRSFTPQESHFLTDRIHQHYRTSDTRSRFQADCSYGSSSILQATLEKAGIQTLAQSPKERYASSQAFSFGHGRNTPALFWTDQDGNLPGSWEERVRFTSWTWAQEYLFLGWAAGEPVFVGDPDAHIYCLGATGSGKTALGLLPLMLQMLRQREVAQPHVQAFASRLAESFHEPVANAFARLLESRLHHNLLRRLAYHERPQTRHFNTNTGTYNFNATYIARHQESLLGPLVEDLIRISMPAALDAPPPTGATQPTGTPPGFRPPNTLRLCLERHLSDYLVQHGDFTSDRERAGFLRDLQAQVEDDLLQILGTLSHLGPTLREWLAFDISALLLGQGQDELLTRYRIRSSIEEMFRSALLGGDAARYQPLVLGLQNHLESSLWEKTQQELQINDPRRSAPPRHAIVILDFKGDPTLFHSVRQDAQREGRAFKFFTPELQKATFAYNPFDAFDYDATRYSSMAQSLIHALGLDNTDGDHAFFTAKETKWLYRALKEADARGRPVQSFAQLATWAARAVAEGEERFIEHLEAKLTFISDMEQLNTSTPDSIRICQAMENREVLYFWLPEDKSGRQNAELIGKLVLEDVFQNADPNHRTLLFIDEFQNIVSENLGAVLEKVRQRGVRVFLTNQTLSTLRDSKPPLLGPVWGNSGLKFIFSAPDPTDMKFIEDASGTRLEEIAEYSMNWGQSHVNSFTNSTILNSTWGRAVANGWNNSGATGSESNQVGGAFGQTAAKGFSHADNTGGAVHYRKERVSFIDRNAILKQVNADKKCSILYVSDPAKLLVSRQIDAAHPFFLRHEFVMKQEDYDVLKDMAWPTPEQYPGSRLYTQHGRPAPREQQPDQPDEGPGPVEETRAADDAGTGASPNVEEAPGAGTSPNQEASPHREAAPNNGPRQDRPQPAHPTTAPQTRPSGTAATNGKPRAKGKSPRTTSASGRAQTSHVPPAHPVYSEAPIDAIDNERFQQRMRETALRMNETDETSLMGKRSQARAETAATSGAPGASSGTTGTAKNRGTKATNSPHSGRPTGKRGETSSGKKQPKGEANAQ